ncbi:cGMP-dependent protein kinase 1-like isoform X3 [Anser cygnoides]|uniref:cGMP-dependent protein kinase 1-like isoform X3 n=1 Tax=Anser cygnoides TaxID=8845 RepID=UPI0034D2FCBF
MAQVGAVRVAGHWASPSQWPRPGAECACGGSGHVCVWGGGCGGGGAEPCPGPGPAVQPLLGQGVPGAAPCGCRAWPGAQAAGGGPGMVGSAAGTGGARRPQPHHAQLCPGVLSRAVCGPAPCRGNLSLLPVVLVQQPHRVAPGSPLPTLCAPPQARQRCGMERQLRELRLQEERDFLQRVARGSGDARALPDTEPPPGWPHRRGTAIVPEPLSSDALLQLPGSPPSQRDLSLIAEAMGRSDFLRRLGEGCPEALAQSFVPVQHGPGDTVLAEGDEGTAMYIVAEGQLSVTQRGRQLRTLGPGDVFGELAILYHCKRTATVQALSPVRLWAIDRQRYRAITTSSAKQRRAKILDSLRTVHWLQDLSDSHLSKLLDAMEECSFAPGHVIIREGDKGESFYIILKGQVRVSRRVDGQEKLLRVLGAGEHFGELSLLENIRRTATCQAQGHVTCITVAKEDFLEIIPFCPRHDSDATAAATEVLAPADPRRGWGSPSLRQPSPAVRLEDLVAVRYEEGQKQGQRVVLGTGGFGRVELVRCREQLFALKRIRKDWVVRTQQQEHVRTERRVLAQSHCPFVVGFFGTFRDRQHVYLLLEFCQGGELWTKLREALL